MRDERSLRGAVRTGLRPRAIGDSSFDKLKDIHSILVDFTCEESHRHGQRLHLRAYTSHCREGILSIKIHLSDRIGM